jgi:myo-inositol 2-dehydrogenase / D-chiro-inositol 1-dehydrogenase
MTEIAIIGTGWVTDLHLKAIQALGDVRVAAIAGRNAGRVSELSARTGARGYDLGAVGQMLREQKLDAALICLPPHLHGDIEARCAEHVRGVLIEKPISCDLDVARRAAEVFAKAGTLVSVAFMGRYRASVARAKQVLATEAGPAVLVNGWWVGQMPPPLWWRTQAQSGGQFVEQCTHLVDLSRYLVGDISEVSAYETRGFVTDVPDYSVADAAVVNVRFASGALGNFSTGCFSKDDHDSGLGIGLTVSTRTVKCAFSSWNLDLELTRQAGEIERVPSLEPDIFQLENAAFFEALRTNDPQLIRSSYPDALETLKVGLAATRSAREGKSISLSEL